MAGLQKDVKYIKEKLDDHISKEQESIDRIENAYSSFLKEANGRFASKLTETIVFTLCALVLIGFIGALVTYFIPKQKNAITAEEVQKLIEQNNNKYFEK